MKQDKLYLLKQGESLDPVQVAIRLDMRLKEVIEEQQSCNANRFSSTISRVIRELENIRARPYITCTKCGTDLTLVICKHHKKEVIQKDIDLCNELRRRKENEV